MGAVHNMTYAQEEKWDISQNTKNLIKNGIKASSIPLLVRSVLKLLQQHLW